MRKLLTRLAAGAAGGTLALAAAAPALAHDEPADGFNAVLHGPHHGLLAAAGEFDKCSIVEEDAGDDSENLIKEGFDVWVFNIPSGEFDESAAVILSVTYQDLDENVQTVEVPGEYDTWIGPESNPHLVAVSVPAGWTLLDGDFNVASGDGPVRVTHTCAGVPGDDGGDGQKDDEEPGDEEPGDEDEQPGDEEESDEALPVTGTQVGGLVVLGAGLVAAGIAMLAVRRRRGLSGLTDA